MWISVLLHLTEIGDQEDGTLVHCVGDSLMKVLTLFPTRGHILEKNPMTVVTVGKASIIKQTLINMSESIQERNLTHVQNVEKIFVKILIVVATKESM